jgi:hypothetical protein
MPAPSMRAENDISLATVATPSSARSAVSAG